MWYIGRCVRLHEHDKAANLEVIARLGDSGWELVKNARRIFGGAGEVDFRGKDAKTIALGEWGRFQLSGKGNKASSLWTVGDYKPLYHYVDLGHLGGAEQVQRYLAAEELRMSEPPGGWVLRSLPTEVLLVDLRQVQGIAQIANLTEKVPAFSFVSDAIIRVPVEAGDVVLYDLRHNGKHVIAHIYDWSSDEAYALRIARAIANTSDPRVNETIAWLKEHAKSGQALQSLSGNDLAAANDALRSGKLVKRLVEDQGLLRGFVNAMLADPRVAVLVKTGADIIAAEERRAARAKFDADMLRELEPIRRQQLAALDAEIENFACQARKEAEDRQAECVLALECELAVRKKEGEEKISRRLDSRTTVLEKQADELASCCDKLRVELDAQRAESEEIDTRLLSLRAEELETSDNLDRLLALVSVAKLQVSAASYRMLVPLPAPKEGTPLQLAEVNALVARSLLLSETGKVLMLQFLALVLAGEVPALCGPDVEDFLLIAESLFANAVSVRLEADPTIITFEDLWLRPGTNVQTALGQALVFAGGTDKANPRTILAIIERAERSGARFWFPALAARARRGELPRRLLICITIENEDNEEAAKVFARTVRFDVRAALAAKAVIAVITIPTIGSRHELDPGERLENLTDGLPAIAPHARQLSVATGQRAARAAVEAVRLGVAYEPLTELFIAVSGVNTVPTAVQPWNRPHA
ncbi:hypothetical protein ACVBEF_04540 [Glaciimonas sp. GG7]